MMSSAARAPRVAPTIEIILTLRLRARWCAKATGTAAPEVGLQQMRQRVHVAQLAVLHPEEMRIRCAAAAAGAPGAKGAEHDDRTDRLVDDESTVRDVHAARYADIAAVSRGAVASVRPAFGAVARVTPRHQIF